MKVAETKLDLFLAYQYVPHLDRVTIGLQTNDPEEENVGVQMWDQRFAFQGSKEEIVDSLEEILAFLEECSPDMYKKKKGGKTAPVAVTDDDEEDDDDCEHEHVCPQCEEQIKRR